MSISPKNHKNLNEPEDFCISISDCIEILRRNKRKIILSTLTCASLFSFIIMVRPVKFNAEGKFKEKQNKQSFSEGSSITSLFLNAAGSKNKSDTKTIMTSRIFLKEIIEPLGLQVKLRKNEIQWRYFTNIKDNLKAEYYSILDKKSNPISDKIPDISIQHVIYTGESQEHFSLYFDSDETFELKNKKGEILGKGQLNTPFHADNLSFTITKNNQITFNSKNNNRTETPLVHQSYNLTLDTLFDSTEDLIKGLSIQSDKDDPSLLKLSYKHPNRYVASQIINKIITNYKAYLKRENQLISSEQIAYLKKREQEINETLTQMIDEHASQMSKELTTIGYLNADQAMAFATQQLQGTSDKLQGIELELKRYDRLENNDIPYDERYINQHTPNHLAATISELKKLQLRQDNLRLALNNSSAEINNKWNESFLQQIHKIEETRLAKKEAHLILADLQSNKYPLPKVNLIDNSRYSVGTWYEQIDECLNSRAQTTSSKESHNPPPFSEELNQIKDQFCSYLTNLIHFLDVNEKSIEERLTHQQAPHDEFQGLNINSAEDLYFTYSKELSNLEAEIHQFNFIIQQLQDPDFEISSLNRIVTDSIIRDIVNKASSQVLALQDDNNRGIKEKERLKKELALQKRFLDLHLKQSVQVLHLRESLLKDKIQSLQYAMIDLLQQQLSVLETQVADTLSNHKETLNQEQELTASLQKELRQEAAKIPQKWASEKLIDQKVQINAIMVEEMTRLVESKIIAHNLDVIQSAALDPALLPIRPSKSHLTVFAVLGALLGALLSIGYLLIGTIIRGIPVSRENLELAGVHFSGKFGIDPAENLATARRLINKFTLGRSMVFFNNHSGDLSPQVANLLKKQGKNVLVLDLCFDRKTAEEHLPGLLQYLEVDEIIKDDEINKNDDHTKARSENNLPKIYTIDGISYIASRGFSRYMNELLCSNSFKELLMEWMNNYDYVIGVTKLNPTSAEAEQLFEIFEHCVFNVGEADRFGAGLSIQELEPLIHFAKDRPEGKEASFVIG